jgi:hypothetical protein
MVAKRSTPRPTRASSVISTVTRAMSLTTAEMMAEAIDPAHVLWRDHGRQGIAVPVLSLDVLSSNNLAHNLPQA